MMTTEPHPDPAWWRKLERDRAIEYAREHRIPDPLRLAWWRWFAREGKRTARRVAVREDEWGPPDLRVDEVE